MRTEIQVRNRQFWCRGYFVDTVGQNKEAIKSIREQLQEDIVADQLSLKELIYELHGPLSLVLFVRLIGINKAQDKAQNSYHLLAVFSRVLHS